MALHIFTGSGAPTSAPHGIGHHYIDTTNKVSYISVGTSSAADWETSDAASVIAAHEAALDPHPQYTTTAEASAAAPVQSVAGKTGAVTLDKNDVGLTNVDNTADLDKPISTATQTALDGKANTSHTHDLSDLNQSGATTGQVVKWNGSAWAPASDNNSGTWGSITGTLSDQTDLQAALDGKQPTIPGSNSRIVRKNSSGDVQSFESWQINSWDGLQVAVTNNVADLSGHAFNNTYYAVNPTENAPGTLIQGHRFELELDPADNGFSIGDTGNVAALFSQFFRAESTGNIGAVNMTDNNFVVGNGTDAIDWRGVFYAAGFGEVRNNVNMVGPIQGYGVQPLLNNGVTIDLNDHYFQGFFDGANYQCPSSWHTSFNSSPSLSFLSSGRNLTGFNFNPTVDEVDANGGVVGVGVYGTYPLWGSQSYLQGINIAQNATDVRSAVGVNVTMNNITPYAGAQSTVTIQDLTWTFAAPGENNGYTMEFIGGGTAGSEVVSISGQDITIQIEDGVSTANQIKAAWDLTGVPAATVPVVITGTGTNTQTIEGPTNFSGGEWPGNIKAARLEGDVEITGSLQFGGALSIGKLNAFFQENLVSGTPFVPASVHSLISAAIVGDNETITNGDLLGINTAMLLQVGSNSTVSTSFVGLSALALPAVVNIGASSSVDQLAGATFAISMDAGAGAGSTIDNLDLCRSIAIPNGITTITTMSGYKFDLPLGNPATTAWGFYESPGVNNYFAGNLLIGGTAGSDDTVTNSSVALEIKSTEKAFVVSRMTTTERNAMTSIDGMVIYNTTDSKFQGYASGSWVDFH